jgi:tRNA-modifying protein YgfZ
MDTWNHFLVEQGGRGRDGCIDDFGAALGVDQLRAGFVAPIGDLGLIALTGEDAASFLHKQLTNDVEHLTVGEARLAGYCSPKGRLMATFLMWRSADAIYLELARDILAPLQKRLQMFVMRAKAKLADATFDAANDVMLGIGGAKADAALGAWFDVLPSKPYSVVQHPLGTLIRLADAFGAPRYQWLMSAANAHTVFPALSSTLTKGGNDAWRLAALHAGVPQVAAATQEQFVPQMINLELLGGVNFKKGCYPGQEIVARSQYLGKLKRRMTLATLDAVDAKAGDEVFLVSEPEQPCGMLVNVAPNGTGGIDALVEMKLAAIEQGEREAGSVRLASADGVPLKLQDMPYGLDRLEL